MTGFLVAGTASGKVGRCDGKHGVTNFRSTAAAVWPPCKPQPPARCSGSAVQIRHYPVTVSAEKQGKDQQRHGAHSGRQPRNVEA